MAGRAFADMIRQAMETDEFWAEKAIIEFTCDIYKEMKRQKKSSSDLARILNTSPAYVTKVFRGNANFTIQSMVKLARALNCRLHIHVANEDHKVNWVSIPIQNYKVENFQWTANSDNYVSLDNKYRGVQKNDSNELAA